VAVMRRQFNALSFGVGLALACFGSSAAREGLQIGETVYKSESWTIGYNSSLKGCVASAISDDSTTVWIGFDGREPDIPTYLAFTNPNWRSIEPRKFYELQIQALGSHGWRGYGSGVERPNEKGLFVFGVKRRFLQEFAQASGVVLLLNKEVLARTNISGAPDAIEKLMSCQERRITVSKTQGIEATRLVEEAQKLQPERQIGNRERVPWEETEKSRYEQAVAREQAGAEQLKQQESEAAAREAREKTNREQAERERVAGEQRDKDKKEQEGDFEKAAQHAALPPTPVEQPPADPELKGNAIVRAIKQELKRVGCYDGRIDEDWQTASAQTAIGKFVTLARLAISPAQPTSELLDAIRARSERFCHLRCGGRQVEKDGRCIAKKCPGGLALDDDGDCIFRRRTVSRHETDVGEERPRVRSYETKRRARADSERELHDGKRIAALGRHVTCNSNGCKKVPIGCRAIRAPDGGNGRGGKILCP
jgi:hypothetical protein